MGNATILIGIGVTCFLISYISTLLDKEEHAILRLVCTFFCILLLLLIPKVSLDDKDFCSWNVINSTTSGDTTSYNYEYQCETNENTTSRIFYKGYISFASLVFIYTFIYLIYLVFNKKIMDMLNTMFKIKK